MTPNQDFGTGVIGLACIRMRSQLTSVGLSRAWAETAKRERWDRKFGIHLLDEWAEQLVEVENSGLDLQ